MKTGKILINFGKVLVIMCIFIYFFLLINIFFFYIDSKSTIGFRRSHVILSYEGLQLQEKIFQFVKKKY